MLAERVKEWTAPWVAEGREQGLKEGIEHGIEQGLAEERTLLCRLAARKFTTETAPRLSVVLEHLSDPEHLALAGDWIIECETEEELLDRAGRGQVEQAPGWQRPPIPVTSRRDRRSSACANTELEPVASLEQILALVADARRWRAAWVAEGYEQGIEDGIEQGIQQARAGERRLLCRMAARKFTDTPPRLSALLQRLSDPERLALVGEWIIEYETEEELLARVNDAEHHERGLKEGIEQGRAEERKLLCRLAARKFRTKTPPPLLSAVLEHLSDPEHLALVGDWIIECQTEGELLSQIEDVLPQRGRPRISGR